ncbi:MAG: ribonuclease J, partial [Alphaproteobacteria bacterium]|nr:ribonuclease J [Alphaproteobacteria bacterium]
VEEAPNRVVVTTFASNIARIKAVGTAARRAGRHLVIAGQALHRNIQVAIETGYLPEGFSYSDQQSFGDYRRGEVVCLVTGSQGESRAALARIAAGEHRDISLAKGDMVIFSSRTIPGNEREVGRIQNDLVRRGCQLVTDDDALVHVTGHPRRDELRQMYDWLKPKVVVPMHGEARHLSANAALARDCNVEDVMSPENGTLVRLAPGGSKVIDDFPVGRLFRDGKLIVPSNEGPVRARRQLAIAGIVMVSFAIERDGEVITDPQIVLDGVPEDNGDGVAMFDVALDAVEGVISSLPRAKRRDPERFGEAVRRAVRSEIREVWGKKPIVKVIINLVEDE